MTEPVLTVRPGAGPTSVTVLHVSGELDHASRTILQQAVSDSLDGTTRSVVLDLSAVTFCDSGGLSLFVELHRSLTGQGGRLRLAGARDMVLGVLKMTNFDRMFTLYPTVQAATRDGQA